VVAVVKSVRAREREREREGGGREEEKCARVRNTRRRGERV